MAIRRPGNTTAQSRPRVLAPARPRAPRPRAAQVVEGDASFSATAGELNVRNAPGTIIEWQSFSIAEHEITRFVQKNASSAVLNRVVGESLTSVLGRLESNAQVFLINPNGIVVGNGAVIDTSGFVASCMPTTFSTGRGRGRHRLRTS